MSKAYIVKQYWADSLEYPDSYGEEIKAVFLDRERAQKYCDNINVLDFTDLRLGNVYKKWYDYAWKHHYNKEEDCLEWETDENIENCSAIERQAYTDWVTKVLGIKSDMEIMKYWYYFEVCNGGYYYGHATIEEVDLL